MRPGQLLRHWRWAVIGLTLIAAVFTPSADPLSMLVLAVPLDRLLFHLHRHRQAPRALSEPPPPAASRRRGGRSGGASSPTSASRPTPSSSRRSTSSTPASSVLVSAPTGSGKTLVAEYAIAATLARGTKVFYTTPLKALSNQKYRDLCAAHGEERVGLLTGDTAIRARAPRSSS